MVSAPDALKAMMRDELHPELRKVGLRRTGRTWWDGTPEGGWVVIGLASWRYNTAERARFDIGVVVWPSGTWETTVELLPSLAAGKDGGTKAPPFVQGPLGTAASRILDRGEWRWSITGPRTAAVADEVVSFIVERLLPLARAHLDVDAALAALLDKEHPWDEATRVWELIYAAGMLEHAAPAHPRFAEVVDALRAEWLPDQRPADLKPLLKRWSLAAGQSRGA